GGAWAGMQTRTFASAMFVAAMSQAKNEEEAVKTMVTDAAVAATLRGIFRLGSGFLSRSAATKQAAEATHVGAGPGKPNLLNPSGHTDRCAACVSALVRNKLA